jgi:predicted ArsR family transcriptional regulator
MVDMVGTVSRERLLAHLKRVPEASVPSLVGALALSENTVRHHLARLQNEGLVETVPAAPSGPGRPARRYRLTHAAEGHFPKRYDELLELVLAEAEAEGRLDATLEGVARRLAASVRSEIEGLPPAERVRALMERLDYGEMLGHLEQEGPTWRFSAYNCVYYKAGQRFEGVCDLLPRAVSRATGLPAERVVCQRDGSPACRFAGSLQEDG